jgi:hypothetical protein
MSLTPEILALLLLDTIFLFFGIVAFFFSANIALRWNAHATTPRQYALQRQSYLVAVIIKYIFILKLPLFLFYIYTCDKLSDIITGAMCASGVVNSVDFGLYLIVFKLFNIYVFGFWLLLHHADLKEETQPFTKLKFVLFTLFALPLLGEVLLEIDFFTSLNVSKIVSCCGTLFSAASSSSLSVLFLVDEKVWAGLFLASFVLVLLAVLFKKGALLIVSNFFFCVFAIISLILFFSPYVYELPTHHCPFCLLQKEYYYVGYVLYTLLFIGTFYGMAGGVLDRIRNTSTKRFFTYSLLFDTLYLLGISAYPITYFIRNGVWL